MRDKCKAQRAFCRCGLTEQHNETHLCEDCHAPFEADTENAYCAQCGQMIWQEAPVVQDNGSLACKTCDDAAPPPAGQSR